MTPNGYAGGEASPPMTVGRPRALDPGHLELVLTLYAQGKGYRAIVRYLRDSVGIDVNWSTVRRAVKGWPPYERNQEHAADAR